MSEKKIEKTWEKWTSPEIRELKSLCKQAESWKELKPLIEGSKILKDRDYEKTRREARRRKLHRHFTDRRKTVSEEEQVRKKQYLFDESDRVIPFDTFKISKESWAKQVTRIGTISRLDYGDKEFRAGLLRLALEEAAKCAFRFNVVVGGLVNGKALRKKLQIELRDLNDRLRGRGLDVEEKREEREKLKNDFYMRCAQDLAELIPRIKKPSGELIKLYIVTSKPFDGEIGDEIAKRLTALRKDDDIIYWGSNPKFPLLVKYIDKTLFPLVSQKQSWMRSDYYSTSVQRVLKDTLKISTQSPSIYGIGCFASSILKPKGESRVPYFSIPALHKLADTRTSENQIGMRAVNFYQNGEYSIKTYCFKDLIRDERKLVTIPPSCSVLQKGIIKELHEASCSSGMVQYLLRKQPRFKNITRKDIVNAIETMKGLKAGIKFDDASSLFDFNPEWFQKRASFELPPDEELKEDRFVAFACPHIGAIQTDYGFIINDIPRYILRSNANYVVLAGDVKQGTHHKMLERGQIYRGLNNTNQEKLAVGLMGTVIARVFEARFKEAVHGRSRLNQDELRNIILNSLVTFLYFEGNHDAWERAAAFVPLEIFRDKLTGFLVREIKRVLKEHDLSFDGVGNIVESRIIQDEAIDEIFYTTPSGLAIKVGHPFTARNLTVSIPGEKFLEMYRESHVNFVGNWHESLSMEHFDAEIGQRVYVQLPTLMKYTMFETTKMKETDFGIGICKVKSYKGRIITSETGFYGEKGKLKQVDNDIIDAMLVNVGVLLR